MAHHRHEELQALVDDEDIDGVLRIADLDELAEAWCRYEAREHWRDEDDDPDWWAVEFFMMRSLFDALWWDHIGDDDLSPAQDAAMRRMLAAIDRMSAMADRDDAEDDQGS
jgi:alkylation response protein AidB-like acyl-CoA dehydrogenase